MDDLLGSILGQMEKPPSLGDGQAKKAREQKKKLEKIQQQERELLKGFRVQTQKKINDFIQDTKKEHIKFEPTQKVYRAIIHEVSDVAGLASFSFGEDEVDRYVMLWKKEFAPTDDELSAYRHGEEWSKEKAQEINLKRAHDREEAEKLSHAAAKELVAPPASNYRDKYERLIGKESAKDAARVTTAHKSYGLVPSDNKRDLRTIEQIMSDNRAKRLKTEHSHNGSASEAGPGEHAVSDD